MDRAVFIHNTLRDFVSHSAFWIPELTTTEKVGHTTYTVTGSYEGKESFLKKLERIVAKNAQQKFEDEGADE